MNFTFNLKSIASIAFASALLFSCSGDDTAILDTPTDPGAIPTEDATIRFVENGTDNKDEANISGVAGGTVAGRVIFETESDTQRRLYVTRTLPGESPMPFLLPLDKKATRRATKADGSIDLDAENKKALDFTLDLDVPTVENGVIVYQFWTTTGRGDFRDPSKRRSQGVGTINVTIGNGQNPDAAVREFTDVKLFAPDSEGASATFFSLLDGTTYLINQGIEFAAFWDFGYYHLNGTGANLSSTKTYRTDVVDVPLKSGTPVEELNDTYFKLADTAIYDSITTSGDLKDLTVSNTDPELIEELKVGDEVEFVDQYGKKGVIKIKEIEPGFSPTQDFIVIDVKIQP
ncbi:hypothetical protein [Aquimarina agarivorans]|uniref:hypothetical protein n=1 Tax=Aquimarina agarivorans TaxID=980584 RepID=UPI00031A80D2|nr:hypothetical protein [Aquimarina agarivorans]